MDGKDPFMRGFTKAAANPMGWLRPIKRTKAMKRLTGMSDKFSKNKGKAEWITEPLEKAKKEGKRPKNQAKKYLGFGIMGTGAGAYGLSELTDRPKTYLSKQHRYGVGKGRRR